MRSVTPSPLSLYVPRLLLDSLAAGQALPQAPDALVFEGAALIADVTGYTAMTELQARAGPAGPERVRDWLDGCFGRVIDQIVAHGGDVLNFAGDAVIALWRGDNAASAARRCAALIETADRAEGGAARLRVGVGTGLIHLMRVGGVNDHWLVVAGGEPFARMAIDARSGQRAMIDANAVVPAPPPPILPVVSSELERWVPPLVAARYADGQGDWQAELRNVSVVFGVLPGLDYAEGKDRSMVQRLVASAQQAALRYEGTLVQALVDDSGCVVLLAFGLPGTAHADDATRASRAALELEAGLGEPGRTYGIGVSTGHAFCGSYGNALRRNYAVVGDVVNFAARLAQQKASRVLCDEATAGSARHAPRISWTAMEPLQVKGASEPRPVFAAEVAHVAGSRRTLPESNTPMAGRETELAAIRARLDGWKAEGSRAPIIIEGEAGVGKTRLCAWVIEQAAARGLSVQAAIADALETTTPYHAWRGVVASMVGVAGLTDDSAVQTAVGTACERVGHREWGPLLGPILQIDLPETGTTRQMSGRVRGNATRELLSAIVSDSGSRGVDALLFDDAQWLDASSWDLLADLCVADQGPLLIVAHRPLPRGLPASFVEPAAARGASRLSLSGLSADEVTAMMRSLLNTAEVAPDVSAFVLQKSEGNPFFVREITRALRELGALQIDDQRCAFVGSSRALADLRLPPTLTGMVTNRIDRLPPQQVLVLKVASVIGRPFTPGMLGALHPGGAEQAALASACELLCAEDVLVTEASAGSSEPTFNFRHSILRDVTYQLMAFAQRRALHSAAASWVERTIPGPAGFGLRAHHWRASENRPKWLESLELAGDNALERGANREAVELFTEALQLDGEAGTDDLRRAHWHAQIGDAWYRLGDVSQSMAFLERALAFVGAGVPRTPAGWLGLGVRQFAVQVLHLIRPPRGSPPQAERRRLLSAAYVWSVVAELHYFATRLPQMMAALFATVNFAERGGAPELAARAYGILAYSVGVGRLHALAASYFLRGKQGKNAHNVANTHYAEGLYELCFIRVDRCVDTTIRGIALAESVGDHFSANIGRTVLGAALQYKGASREALAAHEAVVASARRQSNVQHEVWGLTGSAECLVDLGDPAEALRRLALAAPLMPRADALSGFRYEGVRAWALLRAGDLEGARAARDAALEWLRRSEQPMYAWLYALCGLVEVGIAEPKGSDSRPLRLSLNALRRYALALPFARARLAIHLGQLAARRGQLGAAKARWRKALSSAEAPGQTSEVRMARLELALLEGDAAGARSVIDTPGPALFSHQDLAAAASRPALAATALNAK